MVAADAGRRAAKLAEDHGLAADVVRDAEAAVSDRAGCLGLPPGGPPRTPTG